MNPRTTFLVTNGTHWMIYLVLILCKQLLSWPRYQYFLLNLTCDYNLLDLDFRVHCFVFPLHKNNELTFLACLSSIQNQIWFSHKALWDCRFGTPIYLSDYFRELETTLIPLSMTFYHWSRYNSTSDYVSCSYKIMLIFLGGTGLSLDQISTLFWSGIFLVP